MSEAPSPPAPDTPPAKPEEKPRFVSTLALRMGAVAVVAVMIMGGLWIEREYSNLDQETEAARIRHVDQQRAALENLVDTVIRFIAFNRTEAEARLRAGIAERTGRAHDIAARLVEFSGPDRAGGQIEALVREALRPVVAGAGDVLVLDLDGTVVLASGHPEMEGTAPDPNSVAGQAIAAMVEVALHRGEGTLVHGWPMGETPGVAAPMVFNVRHFAPLGWVIAGGDFVDAMEAAIQAEILSTLDGFRLANGEYVFAGRWDGLSLAGPAKGRNMIDLTDEKGVRIVQELIIRSRAGGGFVEYVLPPLEGARSAPKISYVAPIPDWEWYVGTGVFLDQVEALIAARKAEVERSIRWSMAQVAGLLAGLVLLILAASRRVARTMHQSLDRLAEDFDRAARGQGMIEPEAMAYRELEDMARTARGMVEARDKALAEARTAKEAAELADRAKVEFLATMSHELRTPLNSIIGFSDIMIGQTYGTLGDRRYAEYAHDINEAGRHLLDLIVDILDLSRIESGNLTLDETTIDFPILARACLRMVHERALRARVAIKDQIAEPLPAVRGDARRIKQILVNLLANAVKFTPAEGVVTLSAEIAADGWLEIEVADTGIGIAEQDMERVMDPFVQVDGSLARKHQGAGLGLPLSRRLAEMHGGVLALESELGRGTRAVLRLPPERVLR